MVRELRHEDMKMMDWLATTIPGLKAGPDAIDHCRLVDTRVATWHTRVVEMGLTCHWQN